MSNFSEPVVKILSTDENTVSSDPKNHTPLLSQEEIDDEQPPRVNLTAVICTAIVAVCATIIICVAKPWNSRQDDEILVAEQNQTEEVFKVSDQKEAQQQTVKADEAKVVETKPAEVKADQAKAAEARVAVQKPVEQAKQQTKPAGLPVVPVTAAAASNPYNNVRLIDASSRLLTKAEVAQMSKAELALARNAIYARHGYVYKNAELGEFFSKQSWFKPKKNLKLEDVKPLFSEIEVANINLILAQEKK